MSRTNKAKDRNSKGKIKRKYTSPDGGPYKTPGWWIRMFMSKPQRARGVKFCHNVKTGQDPEVAHHDLGLNKPHLYYW